MLRPVENMNIKETCDTNNTLYIRMVLGLRVSVGKPYIYSYRIISRMIILSLNIASFVNHDHGDKDNGDDDGAKEEEEEEEEEEKGGGGTGDGWGMAGSRTMTYHIFTTPTAAATTAPKATTTAATKTATAIALSVKSREHKCSKRWRVLLS